MHNSAPRIGSGRSGSPRRRRPQRRERARHRALVAARAASPARPRPASVRRGERPARSRSWRAPRRRASPTSPRRAVCAYVADASDADLRAVYDGGGRGRRAAATLGSACGLAAGRGGHSGRRTRRTWPSDDGTTDHQRRRCAVARTAPRGGLGPSASRWPPATLVDLLERLMGPASPESLSTPAIDRAAAAALQDADPTTTRASTTSPRRPCLRARRLTRRIQSIRLWRTKWRRSSRAAPARPTRTTRSRGRRRHDDSRRVARRGDDDPFEAKHPGGQHPARTGGTRVGHQRAGG